MKIFNIKSLTIFLTVLILSGCEKIKDFGDTNVNPNATTVPNTAALLTNVLAGISGTASQQNPGYYCQYFSETQYPTISLYSLPQFDMDGIFAGPLYDCQNIINTCNDPVNSAQAAANGSLANQVAIATILKCYYFWTLTDTWGDIPYSEALSVSNIFPKFDKQESVYKGVIAELTAVVDKFDGGAAVKGDIAYPQNINGWKKLANSLRMLMCLRLSKKYPNAGDYAAIQFTLAVNHPAGKIEGNDDNFTINYPGGSFRNPWFALYDSRDDVGESLQFVQLLNSIGDRRQADKIFGRTDNGVPYGRDRASFMNAWFAANSTTYAKVLGDAYRKDNSPVTLVSAAAVNFARAEAKERGWTTEALSAQQLYINGITSSYTQWGIPASAVSVYLNNTLVAYGTDNLNKIALQRYIALYPDGLQGWSEWRRTGIPVLIPAQNAVNSSKAIPRRFVYGVNDYSTNKTNLTEAAAAIPGDTQDGRVWWDQ